MLEADGIEGETINLGSNFEISIGDTAQIIASVLETELEIEMDDQRVRPKLSEVERLWADNSRAKNILNWSPHYGGRDGFIRGIVKTVEWFKDPSNLERYDSRSYNV